MRFLDSIARHHLSCFARQCFETPFGPVDDCDRHVGHDLARGTTSFTKSTISVDLDDDVQVITEGLLAEVNHETGEIGEPLSA